MTKLILIFSLRSLQLNIRILAFCLISPLLATTAFGQPGNQDETYKPAAKVHDSNKIVLPNKIGEEWTAMGASHTISMDEFSVLSDGDIYIEYGLQTLTTRFYTNGRIKFTVELFQTRFASEAYGLYTFIRSYANEKHMTFYAGRFIARVIREPEDSSADYSFIDSLKRRIVSDEGELPSLSFNLPEERKMRNTERYLIGPLALGRIKEFAFFKEVVSFTGGTQAVTAKYQNADEQMSLIIFEYHTPQLATDGNAQIQSFFDQASIKQTAPRLLKRIGNYIVVAVNIQDRVEAENVIAKIKYSPKIYWEGKKITDLPLQFRPPDPLVIQEASETANMIVRTFYWIGVMITGAILIGLIAGGSIFYWNRYRRRKLGIDNIFSDAGGTIRLNIDEYLLDQVDYSIKSLAKNERKKME